MCKLRRTFAPRGRNLTATYSRSLLSSINWQTPKFPCPKSLTCKQSHTVMLNILLKECNHAPSSDDITRVEHKWRIASFATKMFRQSDRLMDISRCKQARTFKQSVMYAYKRANSAKLVACQRTLRQRARHALVQIHPTGAAGERARICKVYPRQSLSQASFFGACDAYVWAHLHMHKNGNASTACAPGLGTSNLQLTRLEREC